MSGTFEWVPDLTRGEWIRHMEAEPLGSVLSIVPGGFEAYARVFHPMQRDRPRATKTWQGFDETTYLAGVEDIEASLAAASVVLACHTVTPDAGIAAIWDGRGGLVSSAGVGYSTFESDGGQPARHIGEAAVRKADPPLRERLVATLRRGFTRAKSMFEALPALPETSRNPAPVAHS